ncbi:MAG: thioredoxin [Lachnospiraceae bacterium]|nr:thioredoxin [Lachnospiraceae bacterium]
MKEKTTVIRIVVLIAALALLVAGIIDGGFSDVMNKATRICYECIGIG